MTQQQELESEIAALRDELIGAEDEEWLDLQAQIAEKRYRLVRSRQQRERRTRSRRNADLDVGKASLRASDQ